MNTTLQLTAQQAIQLCKEEFTATLSFLRRPTTGEGHGFLAHGSRIIQRWVKEDWRLEVDAIRTGFSLKTSQRLLVLSEDYFGALVATICNRLQSSSDRALVEAMRCIPQDEQHDRYVARCWLSLFLAHEFFHLEQRLGSDQYADSDDYINVVAAADYQADLVAIDYVLQRLKSQVQPDWLVLLLLLGTHISTMQAFSPSAVSLSLSTVTFQRILIWHFQAARVSEARTCPDLSHPSFSTMPVITFPKLQSAFNHSINLTAVAAALDASDTRQQELVVALSGADGILRICRFHSTEKNRLLNLIEGLLHEKFSAVRDSLEELFRTHEHLADFSNDPRYERAVSALMACAAIGDRLLEGDLAKEILTSYTPAVVSLAERVQMLVEDATLVGEGWLEHRTRFPSGLLNWIELVEKNAKRGPPERRAQILSEKIRRECLRIQIRLKQSIADLQLSGGRSRT